MATDNEAGPPGTDTNFLPNFCGVRSVFAVVVVGELLVFVLTLVQPGGGNMRFMGLLSLYVQWIGLTSAAVICVLRGQLVAIGNAASGVISYLLILLVTLLFSALAGYLIVPVTGGGPLGLFMARSLAVSGIVAAVVLHYLYLQHEWLLRDRAAAGARIDALQARIRPHFLFNSLNTIAATIRSAPETAEYLVEELADLFRASLMERGRLVALGDELQLAEGYLAMEQARMGARLLVDWQVDELPTDALVPPLTLQPLLENAVYYGVEGREAGGRVAVRGQREGDTLCLVVENPLPPASARRPGGFGMAQANVRERLALAFADCARLDSTEAGGWYSVGVRFPYRQRE